MCVLSQHPQGLRLLTFALQAVPRGSVRGTSFVAEVTSAKEPSAPTGSSGSNKAGGSDVKTKGGGGFFAGLTSSPTPRPTRVTSADSLAENVVLAAVKVLSQLACEMPDEGDEDSDDGEGEDEEQLERADTEQATRECIAALSLALSEDVVCGMAAATSRFLEAMPHAPGWRHTYITLTLLSTCVWMRALSLFSLSVYMCLRVWRCMYVHASDGGR